MMQHDYLMCAAKVVGHTNEENQPVISAVNIREDAKVSICTFCSCYNLLILTTDIQISDT